MTPRQRECLVFIADYVKRYGVGPSYLNIADGLSLGSASGPARLVNALVRLGYLETEKTHSGHIVRRSVRPAMKVWPGSEAYSLEWAIEICKQNGYDLVKR
jgi:SOS-response transcriptional repressor LexA